MLTETNTDLDLFTPDELRAGLRLILTPEGVDEVVAGVEAIPEDERAFYRWGYELVLVLAESSPAVAERVRDRYGRADDERERIAREQRVFHGWMITTAAEPWLLALGFRELVIDIRDPTLSARRMIYGPPAPDEEASWR